MDDAEDEDHAVRFQDVIQHTVVPDAKAVEGVSRSLDRLDGLPADPPLSCGVRRELLDRSSDQGSLLGRQLLKRADGRWRQLDSERSQSRSPRRVVRPFA